MHRNTQILLTVLALILPQVALAASITVDTSVAGLGNAVTIEGLSPNEDAELAVVAESAAEFYIPVNANSEGAASLWIPATSLQRSGTYILELLPEDINNNTVLAEASMEILPDAVSASESTIVTHDPTIAAGGTKGTIVRVVLKDRYGNPLSGRPVELISSRTGDSIEALAAETDAAGTLDFRVASALPGTLTLRAVDMLSSTVLSAAVDITAAGLSTAMGGHTGNSYAVTKGAFYRDTTRGVATPQYGANLLGQPFYGQVAGTSDDVTFKISIVSQESEPRPQLQQNDFYSIFVEAVDTSGNRAVDYEGTVYLLSTDPEAELPQDGTLAFEFHNQGTKQYTLGLSFRSPGEQTLLITNDPVRIDKRLGELTVDVAGHVMAQPTKAITIESPQSGTVTASPQITVEGTGAPFINVVVTGGTAEVEGETDRDGHYSIDVTLDSEESEHTLKVKDKWSQDESEEVTITLDAHAPEVTSITFTPENPEEEADVLLVVETEPNLQSVTMEIGGESLELSPSGAAPGKYQVLFTAPLGGVYQPRITVRDSLGNASEELTSLVVGQKGLPQVQNVVADGETNAIALQWDPITDTEVDAYRIYVGSARDEFLYTLDTDRPTAAASVAGLRPGTTYYFAVTALQEDRESEEKSETVSATVLGVRFNIRPQDSALLLEWTSLQKDTPLSQFLLEYGVDADALSEQRILNGELRAYTLRDLLNSVTYYLKMTPITTTGEKLEDLTVTGQGTPTGTGFKPTPADPIPSAFQGPASFTESERAPASPKPPSTQPTGIPLSVWALALLAGAAMLFWIHRRKSNAATAAFLTAMERRYDSNGL